MRAAKVLAIGLFGPSLRCTFLHELRLIDILLDFSLNIKAAPHECVIRTSQPYAKVKAEKEAWFKSKVTVSSCATTLVII